MNKIKNALEAINEKIVNMRMLSSDLEAILIPISYDYHITIVGSQPGNEKYFDIAYDSVIRFTNKQTDEESIYFFNREAGKFITHPWLNPEG